MPKTVVDGFAALLARIEPNAAEVAARQSHQRSIQQALADAFPGFNRLEVIGSHTRRTAIRYHSDVDYLAVLGRQYVVRAGGVVRSSTALANVRDALAARFSSTDVCVDGPAVVVKFQGGEGAVDVVPGYYSGTTGQDGYPMFAIPDGAGGWLNTSPQRHGKYLRERDAASGGMLSSVIRLLKAWKHARVPNVPGLSFHLELLLASEGTCAGVASFAVCLRDAFRLLRDRRGLALPDPLGISGQVPLVHTQAQMQQLVNQANFALGHVENALLASFYDHHDEAFRQWDIVFNGHFPART